MLDDSDNLARRCAYYQGERDALKCALLAIYVEGDGATAEIKRKLAEAEANYKKYQNDYVESVGGNEKLKI